MANIRLATLLFVLAFLSFASSLPSLSTFHFKPSDTKSLAKKIMSKESLEFMREKRYDLRDIYDLMKKYGVISPPPMSLKALPPPPMSLEELPPLMSLKASDPPSDNTEAGPTGFYLTFSVGNSKTWINAQFSINSIITELDNYQPSYSSTIKCCTKNLKCSTTKCNGDYFLPADTFNIGESNLSSVPYIFTRGDKTQSTTGFLSFSRSRYSLPSIAQEDVFSYLFSDTLNSYVTMGPVTDHTATLQSTKLVTSPSHPHLYFVNLTQISIGNSNYKFEPTTNSSIVILDTVILPTLLETSVYAKVKSELMKLGNSFNDSDSGLEVCYNSRPNWPDLTLFFPSDHPSSAGAQMVLTNNSYVVQVESGAECAAIFESEGASVIGILAQVNREMVFNISNEGPRLYFSQYPASETDADSDAKADAHAGPTKTAPTAAAAVPTKETLSGILIWSLSVLLLYLHVAV